MADTKRMTGERFSKYVILMLVISFLGWLMETLVVSIPVGYYCDRGFLTMPFCTIYGFALLGIYYLFGTPDEGGRLFGKIRSLWLRYPFYYLGAALLTTSLELGTGLLFEALFHVELWTYAHRPWNFMGYVSLDYSLMWGAVITLIMKFVFPPLKRKVFSLPEKTSKILTVILLSAVSIDFVANVIYHLLT